jgi:hypothetical protein
MQREPETRRHPQVVNLDELAGHTTPGDAIASTMKQLGAATGGGAGPPVRRMVVAHRGSGRAPGAVTPRRASTARINASSAGAAWMNKMLVLAVTPP